MSDKLYELLLKLPRKNLIHLMWSAVDVMQSYNGRSRSSCILEALGATEYDEGKWELPSLKEMKETTEGMGL